MTFKTFATTMAVAFALFGSYAGYLATHPALPDGLCATPEDFSTPCWAMTPKQRATAHIWTPYPEVPPLTAEEARHAGDGVRTIDRDGHEIQPRH